MALLFILFWPNCLSFDYVFSFIEAFCTIDLLDPEPGSQTSVVDPNPNPK
jgi:hypothetical protein